MQSELGPDSAEPAERELTPDTPNANRLAVPHVASATPPSRREVSPPLTPSRGPHGLKPAVPPPPKPLPTEFGSPAKAVAAYNAANIPAILTPGKKGARWRKWPTFQGRTLTETEQQEIFKRYSWGGRALGVAIILGTLARYVVFDFDQAGAYEDWLALLSPEARSYVEKEVPIVRTPKGFVGHVWIPLPPDALAEGGWFRKQVMESRTGFVLARHVFVDKDGNEDTGVRIELRVPGKHVAMAPGSAYGVHDKHPERTWEYLR